MPAESSPQLAPRAPIPRLEFVVMVASLMALSALGIDSMLPAIPDIARRLGVTSVGEQALIIATFVGGFGVGQLVFGPLADRYGRRPAMIAGLFGYVVFGLLAGLAHSFPVLLIARVASGFSIAVSRVVTVALIRDCFSGRAMAQIASLAFMVFMAAPVLAPTLGQMVLIVGSWRLIFEVVAGLAAIVLVWFALRMPETLASEARKPLSLAGLYAAYRVTLTDRQSLGYSVASMVLQGALFGYISSIEPIMEHVYHRPALLGIVFAASAGTMAAANLLNARIVMRVGSRRISQAALVAMITAGSASLVARAFGAETLIMFAVLQAAAMASYGLAISNMSAMAMENMGEIAGTASSVQGFMASTGGAVLGGAVTAMFAGTTVPMHLAFVLTGIVALLLAQLVERGRDPSDG